MEHCPTWLWLIFKCKNNQRDYSSDVVCTSWISRGTIIIEEKNTEKLYEK